MYYSNAKKKKRLSWYEMRKIAFIGIIAIAAAVVVCLGINYYTPKSYTMTVTEKNIKNYSNDSKFLIFTKLDNGSIRTFEVHDSLIKLRFNSADVYANIATNKKYKVKVIGWRIPFFSEYENIMDIEEIS